MYYGFKEGKKFKLPKKHFAQARALQRNPDRRDKIMSFEHIRKFHDALLFGECISSIKLHYKKEVASKKKKGVLMKVTQIHSHFLYIDY